MEGRYLDVRFRLRRGSEAAAEQIFGMLETSAGNRAPSDVHDSAGNFTYQYESYLHVWENWILPIRDKSGITQGAVGCSLDVTESKRFERELKARLGVIKEQQHVISSLSTPIIEVWDGVLTLPIFGNVDSERAAALMDSLLSEVVRTRARFAILDLTGVGVIDTATASHLVSLIRALRLIGTEGIITGIKARIAQTVVGLGVDLTSIKTLSTLQAALRYCMERKPL